VGHHGLVAERVLTEDDDGREVALQPGDRVEVRVHENPTTGYRWQPTMDQPSAVELGTPRYEPSGSAPGASGIRIFPLVAAQTGRAVVEFQLRRPGPDAPSRARIIVRFVVG
jgi:inhibitor of cysteine peptidase